MKQVDHSRLYLKLGGVARDIAEEAQTQARESGYYIFTPKNELESAAIAMATEGKSGWKGSLQSLDYYDRYLNDTCFIFTTQPQAETEKDDNWLLVTFDSIDRTRYWINLEEKFLSEVYAAWAKVVKIPNPQFDPQRMTTMNEPQNLEDV